MKLRIPALLGLVLLAGAFAEVPEVRGAEPLPEGSQRSCSVADLPELPDVRLVTVQHEAGPVPHCRVAGVIGTETNFELLLPDDWNGRFVMGGGGGFVGSVVNTALALGALQKGYATVGTDTGHRGSALDASWALNNLERVVSFGHQAVHRTAVTSKALLAGYYGQPARHNLFFGCSRGGGQALMEAQRYPEDFDGIVAGAPAYDWTGELGGRNTRLNQIMYPDPTDLSVAVITPEAPELLGREVLRQCDSLDGLADGVLNDPSECTLDMSQLACSTDAASSCLSAEQIEAARWIYEGLTIDGQQVTPGYPVGAELGDAGWQRWLTGGLEANELAEFQRGIEPDPDFPDPVTPSAHFAFGNGLMKYIVFNDPDWDYSTYDFSSFDADVARVASTLNATDPDLDAFRARGGKLLLYNGWRDMALTPYGTIEYYKAVVERDPSAADDVRLIMVPGMDHCIGGPGPSFVNWLDEIDNWMSTGTAPESVATYWFDDQMAPTGSRIACAYPNVVEYDGVGDPRDAASFRCSSPE